MKKQTIRNILTTIAIIFNTIGHANNTEEYNNYQIESIKVGLGIGEATLNEKQEYVIVKLAPKCDGNQCAALPTCSTVPIIMNKSSEYFNEQYSLLLSAYYTQNPLDLILKKVEGVVGNVFVSCTISSAMLAPPNQ